MLGRSEVVEYSFGTSPLETQELQSLNGVEVVGDFEVKRCDIWLGSWLDSLAGDDWPIERVGDSSEALSTELRNLL